MNSATTSTVSGPDANSAFVPMTESQMMSTKGGDDFLSDDGALLQLIIDWIAEQQEDPTSIVSQILENFDEIPSMDEAIFEEIADSLEDDGISLPDDTVLDDSIFNGGTGEL